MNRINIIRAYFNTIFFLSCACTISGEELPWVFNASHGSELELVAPFLPDDPIVLEAGAHYGEDTVVLSEKWPLGKIYSFEPCANSFTILQKNTGNCKNVKIFPFGLFSSTGNFIFNFNPSNDGSSSLLEDNNLPGMPSYNDQKYSVFCMNLDEWAVSENVQNIDYMWLDMEGSEYYVLKESLKILGTVKAISTEANFREFRKGMSQFSDLKILLEDNGFTLYKIWGDPNWQATAVFIRSELLND